MRLKRPYLLFLGDAPDALAAKVAFGIRDWRPENAVGQLRLPGCKADLGIAEKTVAEARAEGAETLVIGVANRGGLINESWMPTLLAAIDAGMDVAAGLHPSAGADEGMSLACLEIAGDPQRVSEWLGETVEAPLEDVKVEWVAPHGTPGILAAQVQTPAGLIRI